MQSNKLPLDESLLSSDLLADIDGYIFDIDGTLAALNPKTGKFGPLPGAVELLKLLNQRGLPYVFFTNGTLHGIGDYVRRMNAIGLPILSETMLTPTSVAVQVLGNARVQSVLVLGAEGSQQPLQEAGFDVILPSADEARVGTVDAVYIGWHPTFGLADLSAACNAVWSGARLYVASKAKQYATAQGPALGISASLAAAVSNATGKTARLVGKPSATAFRYAARLLNTRPARIAVVGDDTDLEPVFAATGGGIGIGVETGLATRADFIALPEPVRPKLILNNLTELGQLLQAS